ncbi:DUF4097 domain-containing protein [Salipaludibacillus sp. LMS25]|jgi:DUF4097 and DUF4098 domain-containing protein YvlB|uniref:DUF4097 family beta strand repeat-containing protein n=1 Tax=Salipaludibacillus sp. LMS25 TaxID=2924031 RepID=UPI0020D09FD7|nr:DUF4097 domain-containing protein [Salipaludibacillus sp. LMS25]UTR15995.1 DUF4097 domain-containing protein [Salipaludibacillus sp. LMS25]
MHEERKMILKMIEDGKISAEEGLQLLNALKENDKGDPTPEQPKSAKQAKGPHSETNAMDSETDPRKKQTDYYMTKDVKWDKDGYRRSQEKSSSFATKFSEFIDEAVQKIKEVDLDFNFGSAVDVHHIFQHRDASVKDVNIHIENGNITFCPWEEKDIRVECRVKVYKVRDTEEARRQFLNDVTFHYNDEKLKLESRKKTMKVNTIIYVPKKELEKITLYAFNGKIAGENVTVRSIDSRTVNGKITFNELTAESVQVETVNGAISIDHLNAKQCDVKTMNGTVTINTVKGDLEAETLNGTIHYTLLNKSDARAYIKTTTGSVNVNLPKDIKVEGELKSSVGGIKCDLPAMSVIDEKKEFASKKMSFLSNKQAESRFFIEAEVATGTISIQN